jgi:hypothetical protein
MRRGKQVPLKRETKKIHWRSIPSFATLDLRMMKVKPTVLLCLSAAVLASVSGCNLFRKSKKPKENPAIASDTEANFRERWMERRVPELTAQGADAATARQQAEKEFAEKFPYIKAGRK